MLRLFSKVSCNQVKFLPVRFYSQRQGPATSSQAPPSGDVPGLSDNCCAVPNQPVGPNASKDKEYKNPEYFCYHATSFAEAEVEMAKYRLPSPSNKEKFTRNL